MKPLPHELKQVVDRTAFQTTVGWSLMSIFPYGTNLQRDEEGRIELAQRDSISHWKSLPTQIPDLFAAVTFILETSGALGHYTPHRSKQESPYASMWVENDHHSLAVQAGEQWSYDISSPPEVILEWWSELVSYWQFPLNYRAYRRAAIAQNQTEPNWWYFAFLLMVAADEAAEGVGFTKDLTSEDLVKNYLRNQVYFDQMSRIAGNANDEGSKIPEVRSSICSPTVNSDLVCVQPKSLFPTVGGGTRVFSKNLSLLRPRGLVRTQWLLTPQTYPHAIDSGFNLLLFPIPFEIKRADFHQVASINPHFEDSSRGFKVAQSWLNDEEAVLSMVRTTIQDALSQNQDVHALVFPELALNKSMFQLIALEAKRVCPGLQFITAGTSENCEGQRGNFVWSRIFIANVAGGEHTSEDGYVEFSQSKHHRWKLTPDQIDYYQLQESNGAGLNKNMSYWESFNSRARELHFIPFRRNSVFTTLICEDLARSEPCHEIIRSLGPNLMIALLMDGAQIPQRWGARYATLFSEDHGGAVLTLTSRGLIQRTLDRNSSDPSFNSCYHVGYFRDYSGVQLPLECPPDRNAILLKLEAHRNQDGLPRRLTIDGREQRSVEWKAHGEQPFVLF